MLIINIITDSDIILLIKYFNTSKLAITKIIFTKKNKKYCVFL